MEDWKNFIGSGVGVFCFVAPEIADGAIINDIYLGTLEMKSLEPLPNAKKVLAEQFGFFENSVAKKTQFLRRIKQEVFRVDAAEYIFTRKMYYNSTFNSLNVLNYLLANDFLGFINHVSTIEMTAGNGADFLNYLL